MAIAFHLHKPLPIVKRSEPIATAATVSPATAAWPVAVYAVRDQHAKVEMNRKIPMRNKKRE